MRIKKKARMLIRSLIVLMMTFTSLNLSAFATDNNFKISVIGGNGMVNVIDDVYEDELLCNSGGTLSLKYDVGQEVVLNFYGEVEEVKINGEPAEVTDYQLVYIVPDSDTNIEVTFSDEELIFDDFPLLLALSSHYLQFDSGTSWGSYTNSTRYGTWRAITLDGYSVYCIEPKIDIDPNDYYSNSSNGLSYYAGSATNATKLEYAVAMAHQHYADTGNKDWLSIAQGIVWEYTDSYNGQWLSSNTFNTQTKFNNAVSQMISEATAYQKKPHFNNYLYPINADQEYRITDNNGVLKDYTVKSKTSGLTVSVSGNDLVIKADSSLANKEATVTLERKIPSKSNVSTECYYASGQDVGRIGLSTPVTSNVTFTIKAVTGSLTLKKASANTELTDGNDCYSLEGAKYTVYKEQACTNSVGVLTTKADGTTNTLALEAGTYYIKETTAPKGYALDPEVHRVTVASSQTTTFEVSDIPQNDPIDILLHKVDADTGEAVPTEKGSLADAEFTFKFYAGEYDDNVDPATLGKSPTRTWVMKTDEDGYVIFDTSYKISGDEFYLDPTNNPTLPIGTLTIQETKSPVGYHIDNTVFVRRITSDGFAESVNTYNAPIIKENAVKFHIVKFETGTTTPVKDVEFIHTMPDGSTETLKTDSNGRIDIEGLAAGKHIIKESRTSDGLIVAPNTFSFDVNSDGSITNFNSDLQNDLFAYSVDDKGDGNLIVYNSVAPFSIKVNKSNQKNTPLADAEFTLYGDQDCTDILQVVTTDSNGIAQFGDLDVNVTYYLRETKAPAGYRLPVDLNGRPITYTIRVSENSPAQNIFNFVVDGKSYNVSSTNGSVRLEGDKADRQITFDIVNEIKVQLPTTGSAVSMFILSIGVIGLVAYEVKKTKTKSVKDEESDDLE